ncbi:hypothetical protein RRG08_062323 [Elysia crispata]|uniref:Uncharacterized protein n=1 Tax=Elysia crispata TaxID=231223 RepID=A0AAE0YGN0_9GAST|nr:hypothetical protein RRG08_062323 [Elysia crispata]
MLVSVEPDKIGQGQGNHPGRVVRLGAKRKTSDGRPGRNGLIEEYRNNWSVRWEAERQTPAPELLAATAAERLYRPAWKNIFLWLPATSAAQLDPLGAGISLKRKIKFPKFKRGLFVLIKNINVLNLVNWVMS